MLRARYCEPRSSSLTLSAPCPSMPVLLKKYYHQSKNIPLVPLPDKKIKTPRKEEVELDKHRLPICDDEIPVNMVMETKLKNVSDLIVEELPPLPPIESSNFHDAFVAKIRQCSLKCNFINSNVDKVAKRIITKSLTEIYQIVENKSSLKQLKNDEMKLIIEMAKSYIIRPTPGVNTKCFTVDELPSLMELSWPHLSKIYEILDAAYKNDPQMRVFTWELFRHLIPVLESSDDRERNAIKFLLQNYYSNNKDQVDMIVKSYDKNLSNHIELNTRPYIVDPILQNLKIICQNNKKKTQTMIYMYKNTLLKLFRDPSVVCFHRNLFSVIQCFFDEPEHVSLLVTALVKYFSLTRNSKQSMIIKFMTKVLPLVKDHIYMKRNSAKIFAIYANGVISLSTKVVEVTFKALQSDKLDPIFRDYGDEIFPVLYPNLYSLTQQTINFSLNDMAKSTISKLNRIHVRLMQNIAESQIKKLADSPNLKNWALIARSAAKIDSRINLGEKLQEITQLYSTNKRRESFENNFSPKPKASVSMSMVKLVVPKMTKFC